MNKQTEALKIGDRVVIKDTAGFSKRLHGIITDYKQDKFWVLRDGADKPVWFHPDELELEEALEQLARLVSYAPDKSTCTLNIDGEEVYFNREQPAQNYRTVTNDDKLTESQEKVTERETQEPVAWISVKDRLPPQEINFLSFSKTYGYQVSMNSNNPVNSTGLPTLERLKVTHWMPLPEAPKELS